ncbi:30S ribosomal protein S17 [Candidatus Woesebacteria bacterium]|nr:30S ribosomal protein S17 [Candidatus Woesebacteria bacterium]|tara:strand:+ start:551 stop:820 length:270 start_codon:yes stop_codon:yes gene_type:complete
MDKTAVVRVERFYTHPLYGKKVRRSKRYHVHDEIGVEVGEVVQFVQTKPISKTKRWKLVGQVTRNSLARDSKERRVTSLRENELRKEKK